MFDLNKTPLAPTGCKIGINEKLDAMRTWAPHGAGGWYIGTAMEHYICHNVYVKPKRAE